MEYKLFITGVKHCGKSTVGKLLAKKLGITFFDIDDIIEQSVKMSVRDFYIKEGKERFLEEETKAIQFLETSQTDGYICSTGGGICDNEIAYSLIKSIGLTIFINEEFTTLFNRVMAGGLPAFLKGEDPEKEFLSIYNRRTRLYSEGADISLNTNKRLPNEISNELYKKIKEFNYVR